MHKNKQQEPVLNIGTSLLLVLFLILCMVTFAALSLSSARSDYSFSEKMADRQADYYEASNTAEEILDEIDLFLSETPDLSFENITSQINQISDSYDGSVSFSTNNEGNAPEISYEIPVNERQNLCVTIEVTNPRQTTGQTETAPNDPMIAAGYYKVTQWQIVNQAAERGEQTLQLLPMDEPLD